MKVPDTVDVLPHSLDRRPVGEIWTEFRLTGSENLRNELMLRYRHLVDFHAKRFIARLPAEVDLEDLISEGYFGLMDAIDAFDLNHGVKFKTFCASRIRGAILDHLRSLDWWPRLVRARSRQYAEACKGLEMELGRPPTDEEVIGRLGVSRHRFERIRRDASTTSMYRFGVQDQEHTGHKPLAEIDSIPDRRPGPVAALQRKDLSAAIAQHLSRAEQCIVQLYYLENMTLKQVGQTLGLTESRVCQMLAGIKPKLKGLIDLTGEQIE